MNPASALLALVLAAAPAGAVFHGSEPDRVDAEGFFDREYFLDLRSFAAPLDWERLWDDASGPRYRINAASLDCCELWLDQRLAFRKRLNDRLRFDYSLEHRGDKDLVSLFQWIGLDAGLGGDFWLGVFGEPAYAKQDADIGAKLAWEPGRRWVLAARAAAVDFNFNDRGTGSQSYARKPATYDFSASYARGKDRLRAAIELDSPLILETPASGSVYQYRRTRTEIAWDRFDAQALSWRIAYRYEFKREAVFYTPDTLLRTQDHHRRVHRLELSVEAPIGLRDRFEAGADGMVRGARSDFATRPSDSSRWKRWEFLPYARWRRTIRERWVSEAAVFLSTGENRRIRPSGAGPDELQTVAEGKLGLGVDFLFGPSGRIGVYGTFDLDDADSHPWDGGNMRAMFLF